MFGVKKDRISLFAPRPNRGDRLPGTAAEGRIQSRPRSRRRASTRARRGRGWHDLPRSRRGFQFVRCRVGTRTGCAGTRPFWQCGTTYHVGLDRTHTHTPFATCEFRWSCITHCLMLQRIRWRRIHRPALSPRRRNPRPTVVRRNTFLPLISPRRTPSHPSSLSPRSSSSSVPFHPRKTRG